VELPGERQRAVPKVQLHSRLTENPVADTGGEGSCELEKDHAWLAERYRQARRAAAVTEAKTRHDRSSGRPGRRLSVGL